MLGAEKAYAKLEQKLQQYLDTYEATHNYDEYHFYLDEIEMCIRDSRRLIVFIGLPPENRRGGQLVRCPPLAKICLLYTSSSMISRSYSSKLAIKSALSSENIPVRRFRMVGKFVISTGTSLSLIHIWWGVLYFFFKR